MHAELTAALLEIDLARVLEESNFLGRIEQASKLQLSLNERKHLSMACAGACRLVELLADYVYTEDIILEMLDCVTCIELGTRVIGFSIAKRLMVILDRVELVVA